MLSNITAGNNRQIAQVAQGVSGQRVSTRVSSVPHVRPSVRPTKERGREVVPQNFQNSFEHYQDSTKVPRSNFKILPTVEETIAALQSSAVGET